MISKFGTLDAPVEVVRDLFLDIEAWPQWMPAVRDVRVLERSESRAVAEVDRVIRRRVQTTKMEFLFKSSGYRERQVAGIARKWEAEWGFQAGPRNSGTLVSCRLEIDMGFIGLLAPASKIQKWIDHTFEETLAGGRSQVHLAGSKLAAGKGEEQEIGVSKIQVFATPTELEIWIGDRKYVARTAD